VTTPVGGRYARGVLAVLTLVYLFNFLDRQILAILAERIKRDLALSDAELGMLYGTSFAVFYAVLGIPLGRLADVWDRRRLISIGLAFWSVMTALSGLCRTLFQLGAARVGVAVGEAGASPAAFSLLSDWFPPRQRATVLALYSGGVHLGTGMGMIVGGQIVARWDEALLAGRAPLDLRGWQVAFFAVGLPGLLLALIVRSLREPVRGQAEALAAPETAPHPHPFRTFGRELATVLPPATLIGLAVPGGHAGARRMMVANALCALAVVGAGIALYQWLGNPVQWTALALGLYAFFSWAQSLRLRDPPCFALLFRTPTLWFAAAHFSLLAFVGYGVGFWTAPYFVRVLGVGEAEFGTFFGLCWMVAGFTGAALGGFVADRWRRRHPGGRLFVGMISAVGPIPFAWWLFSTGDVRLAQWLNVPVWILLSMWAGCGASTVQDLVLPRMRASAGAAYLLCLTLGGLALGPYVIGRISMAAGDLRSGILSALLASVLAAFFALLAARRIGHDEASMRERAVIAGETLL
jgi:MFS family permease